MSTCAGACAARQPLRTCDANQLIRCCLWLGTAAHRTLQAGSHATAMHKVKQMAAGKALAG